MLKLTLDQDEILRQLANQSAKGGENIRITVRDVTLKALQGRELTLAQISQVLRAVTEGVNMGAAKSKVDPEGLLSDALAGMDDALLKAVEANRVALQRLSGDGRGFEQSQMKKALDQLEKYEDTFLKAVKQASAGATDKIKEQWAGVLKHTKVAGTDTGAQVAATMAEYGDRMQAATRDTRTAGLKAAHAFTRNYATLASGVLIGLSEALLQKGAAKSARSPTAPAKTSNARKTAAKRRK